MTPRQQVLSQGYASVAGVLSSTEVAHLRQLLEDTLHRMKRNDLLATEFVGEESIARVPFRPPVVATLREVLGDDYVTIPEFAAQVGKYAPWHRDAGSQGPSDYLYDSDYLHVECAVYLQDNDPVTGGGLDVVPRSHKAYCRVGGAQTRFSRGVRRLICSALPVDSIPSRAGDLVLWDFRLLHRATPGASTPSVKKLGVFWGASRRTRHVELYMNHLRSRGGELVQAAISGVRFPGSFHPAVRRLIAEQGLRLPDSIVDGSG